MRLHSFSHLIREYCYIANCVRCAMKNRIQKRRRRCSTSVLSHPWGVLRVGIWKFAYFLIIIPTEALHHPVLHLEHYLTLFSRFPLHDGYSSTMKEDCFSSQRNILMVGKYLCFVPYPYERRRILIFQVQSNVSIQFYPFLLTFKSDSEEFDFFYWYNSPLNDWQKFLSQTKIPENVS